MASQTEQTPNAAPNPADAANERLNGSVTVPAFFEKIASDGVPVSSQEAAVEMLKTAELVCPAVARSIERILNSQSGAEYGVIKAAADAAAAFTAVTQQPQEKQASTAFTYTADPDVVGAARSLVAEQIKQAGLADLFGKTPPVKTEAGEKEDEEDENKPKPVTP